MDFNAANRWVSIGGVIALARTDQHHQRQAGAAAQLVDLRGQAAP